MHTGVSEHVLFRAGDIMWGSHLTRGFIAPSALCPTFVSTPLWPLHFTSCPLCPRTVQVPWLWAKAICQTFSAIPELPVLPKNAGTSEGQSEWWRHVPSWEGLETDPTCILSQHSLLGKGAERQVSQCCLWTERGSFMRLAVGQPDRKDLTSEASPPASRAMAQNLCPITNTQT